MLNSLVQQLQPVGVHAIVIGKKKQHNALRIHLVIGT
jgi:hypothetical protein